MNQVSHLSLEDLIAVARGEPADPPAAGHLAMCEGCAGEVRKWTTVAGGVRVLVTRSEPPGHILGQVFLAVDDWPSRPVMRAEPPAGTARRGVRGRGYAWLAAGAAAVVLAAGGYGMSTFFGHASGNHASARTDAALTATGCSTLKAVGGTLISVNGSALSIRAADGSSVTVTTSADTKVVREIEGTLRDIADGSQVTVFGSNSGGTIDAKSVALRNGVASSLAKLPAGPAGSSGLSLHLGLASGTAADVTSSGFTVNEPDGSRVQVTTSPVTTVLTLVTSRIGQLKAGKLTSAVGDPGPDGTLAATMVEQDALTTAPAPPNLPNVLPGRLPKPGHGVGSAFPSPPARPSPGNLGSLFSGLGCSQGAIATTYLISLSS
jgi:hypothetical protein